LEARLSQPGMARAFRIVTLVWGVTLLAEAVARVVVVETTSVGDALLVAKLMPYIVLGLLMRWMMGYLRSVRDHVQYRAAVPPPAGPDTAQVVAQR
jgi:hypothetical protein